MALVDMVSRAPGATDCKAQKDCGRDWSRPQSADYTAIAVAKCNENRRCTLLHGRHKRIECYKINQLHRISDTAEQRILLLGIDVIDHS
jgi:hypothetical protein